MRGLAITVLVLTAPAAARADALWCGTFDDERRPLGDASSARSQQAPRSAARAAPPALRVRVDGALVDGARDAGVGRRIGAGLALDRCLAPGEVGRGAAWDLDLLVGADGAVLDARVRGEARGASCVTDGVRAIRFPRGTQPRHVSARVVAAPG
ncbi:MAG TPA: hypothetical protein VNO30_49975 [Kofleriaceae bacterium]|nr:hypothetical protein [Kofleriaceae bacterium]